MGNCLSSVCPCFFSSTPKYTKIPEAKVIDHASFPTAKFTTLKESEMVSVGSKLTENSAVFEGAFIEEKFSNKGSYGRKFVWVDKDKKTLNVSDFNRKDRKHQEASLVDVVSVAAGKPDKVKTELNDEGKPKEFKEGHLCLSIKFMRGGIDLKFTTENERDLWLAGILQTWKQ